jgi:hypothetical protein
LKPNLIVLNAIVAISALSINPPQIVAAPPRKKGKSMLKYHYRA